MGEATEVSRSILSTLQGVDFLAGEDLIDDAYSFGARYADDRYPTHPWSRSYGTYCITAYQRRNHR